MDATQDEIDALYEMEVMSVDGDRLGKVRQVYLDDETGRPAWITVHTGWFGHKEHPVPLVGAERGEHDLRVAVSGDEVREAPTVEPDEHLSEAQVAELGRYYALAPADDIVTSDPAARAEGAQVRRTEGTDVIGDGTLTPEQAVTGASLNIIREGSDDLTPSPSRVRRHERS